MFSIPLNYGLSRADTADASQPTLAILIQSLDSLDDNRLGAWLPTVARRHTWPLMERRREGTGKGGRCEERDARCRTGRRQVTATLGAIPMARPRPQPARRALSRATDLALRDPQAFSYAEVAGRGPSPRRPALTNAIVQQRSVQFLVQSESDDTFAQIRFPLSD